jgi:hypothetical protein
MNKEFTLDLLKITTYSSITAMGLYLNYLSANPSTRYKFGPIGDYIGDFVIGGAFATIAANLGVTFVDNEKLQKIAVLGSMTLGIIGTVLNETIGLGGGTPALADLIAPAVGLICACGLLDSIYKIYNGTGIINNSNR